MAKSGLYLSAWLSRPLGLVSLSSPLKVTHSPFSCAACLGLMQLLDESSARASQIGFALVAGAGLGMLFHAPFQMFTRILKPAELASGTSAFFLVRFTGATIGLVRCQRGSPDNGVVLIALLVCRRSIV